MDLQEYQAMCDRLIADFTAQPSKYMTEQDVCKCLLPGVDEFDDANRRVMQEAIAHLRFTARSFQAALTRRQKAVEKQAKEEAKQQQIEEESRIYRDKAGKTFGTPPETAREAVANYADHNKVTIRYDGTCYEQGKTVKLSSVENSILLGAEALGLTLGNDRIMSASGIKLAFAEFVDATREARKQAVWQAIESTERVSATKALIQLRMLCDKLFIEPEFADAAIRKWIWQVKRRLAGLYVKHLHMIILRGGQFTGKTEFCRSLISPIREIACEAALPDILDPRNFMLRSMYVAFPDELARAERSDMNQLKTVITGESSTARVLYSHTAQKSPLNLSLLGTADKPVSMMLSDMSGMRRFVEVITKPREQLNLDWEEEVVALPWTAIWQAVDYTTEDPLMSQFEQLLLEKQEAMRRRSNVEAWIEQFEFSPKNTTAHKNYVSGEFVEYAAADLYRYSFRSYEDMYHPGANATSLTSWGLTMKDMIDSGRQPLWSYRKTNSHVLYRYELTNVVPMKRPSEAKGVVLASAAKDLGAS